MLVFQAFLIILIHAISHGRAAVVSNSSLSLELSEPHTNLESTGCSEALKHDAVASALRQIDNSVQGLQEKAHTWAIFRHHIEAWNAQMQTLEQQLELLKRTHDEQHTHVGNKLTSLEFSLNHVLSKVVYLSDSCNAYVSAAPHGNQLPHIAAAHEQTELLELLRNMQQSNGADHKLKNEISTRLSNILRHVQNDCTRAAAASAAAEPLAAEAGVATTNKMANLMLPAGGACNMEQTLKTLERKLNAILGNLLPQKDFKQMKSLAKKNAKLLEHILSAIAQTDKRLEDGLLEIRTMAGELNTFTESSDLLLKRIEKITSRLNRHVEQQPDHNTATCKGVTDTVEAPDDDDDAAAAEDHRDKLDEDDNGSESESDNELDDNEEQQVITGDDDSNEHTKNAGEVEFVQPLKTACHELEQPRVDGIYKFASALPNKAGRDFYERFCVFQGVEGVAWTVIQNRGPYAEQENFNRSWAAYSSGFGSLHKDFWYGNEFVHRLSYHDDYELRVELEDFEGVTAWAEYAIFRLDSEHYNYNLLLGGYRGTVPDSLMYHNGLDFSTFDRRNDRSVDACCACATGYASGWWFNNCSEANLNGVYHNTPKGHNYVAIIWENWRGDYSLMRARMMIRPTHGSKLAGADDEDDMEFVHAEDP